MSTQNTWNETEFSQLRNELVKVRNVWVQNLKEMKANKRIRSTRYYHEVLDRIRHLTWDIHALIILPKIANYLGMDGCNVEGTPDIKYYNWAGQRLLSVGTGLQFCMWGGHVIYTKLDYSQLSQIYWYLFTNRFQEMVEEKGYNADGQPVELRNLTMQERLGRTLPVLSSGAVFEIAGIVLKPNPNYKEGIHQ